MRLVIPEFWKAYYWNIKRDLPRDQGRSLVDKFKWIFLFPYYRTLSKLARYGFLDTQEGCYASVKDFTLFFWRTLVDRAVIRERRYWESRVNEITYNQNDLLEKARRQAKDEIYDWLEEELQQ